MIFHSILYIDIVSKNNFRSIFSVPRLYQYYLLEIFVSKFILHLTPVRRISTHFKPRNILLLISNYYKLLIPIVITVTHNYSNILRSVIQLTKSYSSKYYFINSALFYFYYFRIKQVL